MLRAYTLREYAVVLAMAVLASLGLIFMLNSMGGGATAGETLLKRETVVRKNTASLRFVEENAAARARARARAKAADLRRAKILAARRIVAQRAARRASAAAARRSAASTRAVTRTTPQALAPQPTRVVNPAPSQPTPRPQPAPAPKPTPNKSGSSGGGGGGFDDSG
jgi:hypothetical protein